MGIIKGIVDFANFKEFVTPAILKALYLVIFLLLNVVGLAAIVFMLVTGILAALASNDSSAMIISIIVTLIVAAISFALLILYNLMFRICGEVVLLMFNMHGFLKSMDEKMGRR